MSNNSHNLEMEMKAFINEICERIGPREPCSDKEANGAKFFYNKLKNYYDDVTIEKFPTHLGAFKGGFRIPMVLYIVSIISYWYYPWLSFILSTASLIILIGEMTMAREVIDFLFPKKTSQNVIAKIRPEAEADKTKKLVIIGSHMDSNWEFPLFRKLGYGFPVIIAVNLFLNSILMVISGIKLVLVIIQNEGAFHNVETIFFWIFICGVPFALAQLFFSISNRPVMGANDNLSAVAICYELAKYLSVPENPPKNTEVWIAAFGCEETGSKGSKAFVKKHYDEIKDARVINIDMVGNKNVPLFIGTSEIVGSVKMDKKIIALIKEFADKYNIPVKAGPSMAFTDSLSFARKGIASVSILSMPGSSKEFYYHTREDTIENMDFKNLVDTYKIVIDVINTIDNS